MEPQKWASSRQSLSIGAQSGDRRSTLVKLPYSARVPTRETGSSFFGVAALRVFARALGFGSLRNRLWHQANPTPTSRSASERPQGQANSQRSNTRYVSPATSGTGSPVIWFGAALTHKTRSPGPRASLIAPP